VSVAAEPALAGLILAQRPRVLLPGLLPPDPGLERYRVRPGAVTALQLGTGDELTIIDVEGRQRGELTAFGSGGEDYRGLGASPDTTATVVRALAGQLAPSLAGRPGQRAPSSVGEPGQPWRPGAVWTGAAVASTLAARGLDPAEARAVALFGEWSPASARVSFVAQQPVTCVVAAPGGLMSVDEHNPPSDLLIEVRRPPGPPGAPGASGAARAAADGQPPVPELPPPLADPLLDLRVDKATAMSYEVKAGQYIQVIDVEGRQCSDFLAFNARRLADGVERGLDATTTRNLMGNAYPQPGLFGKFFDQDMRPLVEVVRDTVGRHDTFALACNAKYYEDMGYPGHVNCTDNFNGQLKSYGIAERRGWPALNFFYNTFFNEANQLFFDEPWSQPGDYVLLRAMTDLLCASSACPDDIDPANAWNPTDVHVRVYPAERSFSMAIAHRVTPDSEPKLTRETSFQPRWSQLTRQQTEYRGYWLPTSFDGHGAIEEYWACREAAAVMDLSPLRKFEVVGPDAEALLQAAVTRNVRKLAVGQVVYTAVCNETGGMLDDATIFRLGQDRFRFVGGEEYDGTWLRALAEKLNLDQVWVKHSTDQLHNIAVQGPKSRDLLRELVWTPPTQPAFGELGWFRFAIGRIGAADGLPVIVSRTGYTGELGYELWCHPQDATSLWDAVWEAGSAHGLVPLGLDALDILRIEAGLIFAGYEFCDQTDPFEAGIGFTVPLKSKEDDFVGREALERRKAAPQRTLVGLELAGNEPAAHGDCVHVGRSQVGVITSGTRSPILRKNIALCRMAVEYSELGTEVEVGKLDGHRKRIPAVVVRFPFYDPDKTRPRS
jgi:glycine cleavage system T protein (aminomethyltransferase)